MSEFTEPQLQALKEVGLGMHDQKVLGDIRNVYVSWGLVGGYCCRNQQNLKQFVLTDRGREVLADA